MWLASRQPAAEERTSEQKVKGGATTAAVGQGAVGRNDRPFYTGMSAAIILTVFVGFAPTYYLKGFFGAAPLAPLVHVHGLVFTCWILLFFAQTVLIARHRTGPHRRLGVAGAGLAALVVVVGLTTTVAVARRVATGGAGRPLSFLAVPFGDMLVFAVLAAAGILYRRRPETHKRLLLVATIGLLDAAFARWPFAIMKAGPVAWFVVTDLFVLAGVCYDLVSRRHVHPANVWGGLLLLISQPIRLAVGHTDTWLALVGRLVR
jgi:hypothetical protein